MTELGQVISSTALAEPSEPVGGCVRESLGLTCLRNEYVCLCELSASGEVRTVRNDAGTPTLVYLTMQGVTDPKAVLHSIDLTGYKPDVQIAGREVQVSFNLRRPQNLGLKAFMQTQDR